MAKLADKWLRCLKLMRQVSKTSLGDDARETLTIAGLEKAKERALNNICVCVLHKPGLFLGASVDQFLRTPSGHCSSLAVVSTCACCGKQGQDKSNCRWRNAKCNNCGKIGHLQTTREFTSLKQQRQEQ